jgi:pilus assembly protein CpaB
MDRQKVIMIFGAALVCATLLSWFLYAQTKGPKTEKTTKVIAAARDLPAGTRLRRADLKTLSVPTKDLPKGAMLDEKATLDRVLLYPVNAGEPLLSTKLASASSVEGLPAIIEPGKRAISVPITDSSSAGGLIQPRSHVDVLFTRAGSMNEALTTTILQDVVVLSIGKYTEAGQQNLDPRAARPQTQAATLMVTPEQARILELAKNQGRISLALRNPLDRSTLADNSPVTAEALDPNLLVTRRRAGPRGTPNLRDPKVWQQLTATGSDAPRPPKQEAKREAPKPRFVVDVYRGDKHVQEIFQ